MKKKDEVFYISKLKLNDIKCFKRESIDFNSTDRIGKWGVILGDNGLGKTTILQSIAISLASEASASGLMDELYGEWIRKGETEGSIELELKSNKKNEPIKIETVFRRKKTHGSVDEITVEGISADDDFWYEIFVCGYGASRGVLGSTIYQDYFVTDAVYTLFNYDYRLQNPELAIRRIKDGESVDTEILKEILGWIEHILMFPKGSIKLGKRGIELKPDFPKDLTALLDTDLFSFGDGHRATLTWISDFLGWAFFHDEEMFKKGMRGIVLIDEIEQHLHPSWQKSIIKRLHDCFPNVQFIITTHSPLCAIGTTELKDEVCTLSLLTRDETGRTRIKDKLKPPSGLRADQVLTSYLFGLTTSGDNDTINKIERYSALMRKERTDDEEEELQSIRKKLDKIIGTEETELQRIVAQSIKEVLQKKPEAESFDKKAIDYEVKRQLNELFSDIK